MPGAAILLLVGIVSCLFGLLAGLALSENACGAALNYWWLPAPLAAALRVTRAWYVLAVSDAGMVQLASAFVGSPAVSASWTAPAVASAAVAFLWQRCSPLPAGEGGWRRRVSASVSERAHVCH